MTADNDRTGMLLDALELAGIDGVSIRQTLDGYDVLCCRPLLGTSEILTYRGPTRMAVLEAAVDALSKETAQ
jgi:hypothetical protein